MILIVNLYYLSTSDENIIRQFQGILKPAYNSVDMTEVELMDQDKGPREFDEGIIMVLILSQADESSNKLRFHARMVNINNRFLPAP